MGTPDRKETILRNVVSGIERFRKLYPFTWTGTALLAAAVAILGNSYATRNPYGYILSLLSLSILVLAAIVSRIQGNGLNMNEITWNTAAPVHACREAKNPGSTHTLEVSGFATFPMFRLHTRISGTLRNRKHRLLYIFRDFSGPAMKEGTIIPTPLRIPVSGELYATARIIIKDLFGISRCEALDVHKRQIPILPETLGIKVRYHPAAQGAEEQTKMKNSDIERYYMRDYVPGDRFRDINWKASGRTDTLFTRISPVAEEKTSIITVWLRLYTYREFLTLKEVLHADFLKSWLMTFLSAVRQDKADYIFRIIAGGQDIQLNADDEFSTFASFLADIPCEKHSLHKNALLDAGIGEGNVYVFAPYFDPGLPALESVCPGVAFHRHVSVEEKTVNNKDTIVTALLPGLSGRDIPCPWILDPRPLIHDIRGRSERPEFPGRTSTRMTIRPVLVSE